MDGTLLRLDDQHRAMFDQLKQVAEKQRGPEGAAISSGVDLLNKQAETLQLLLVRQKELDGPLPWKIETVAPPPAAKQRADVEKQGTPPQDSEVTEEAAKPMDAVTREKLLTDVFAVADTLERDELRGVAFRSSCRDDSARMVLNKMKGAPAPPPAGPDLSASPNQLRWHGPTTQHVLQQRSQQQQQQIANLALLTTPDGDLKPSLNSSISLVLLMEQSTSYSIRTALLNTLTSTRAAVLYRFVTSRMLVTLAGWLQEADEDACFTFTLLLLRALQFVPIPLPMLVGSALNKTVTRLSKNKNSRVAQAGSKLSTYWRLLVDGQRPEVAASRAGLPVRSGPHGPEAEAVATSGGGAAGQPSTTGRDSQRQQGQLLQQGCRRLLLSKEKERAKLQLQKLQQSKLPRSTAAPPTSTGPSPALVGPDKAPLNAASAQNGAVQRRGGGLGCGAPLPGSRERPWDSSPSPDGGVHPSKRLAVGGSGGIAVSVPQPAGARIAVEGGEKPTATAQQRYMASFYAFYRVFQGSCLGLSIVLLLLLSCTKQHAQQCALSVSENRVYQQEAATVFVAYSTKAKKWSSMREERRRQEALASRQDMTRPKMFLCAKLAWRYPSEVPRACWEEIAHGEDSTEFPRLRQAASQTQRVQYPSTAHVPHSPAEPAQVHPSPEAQAKGHVPMQVPWVSSDPSEALQQNQKVWEAGVRIAGAMGVFGPFEALQQNQKVWEAGLRIAGFVMDPSLPAKQLGPTATMALPWTQHFSSDLPHRHYGFAMDPALHAKQLGLAPLPHVGGQHMPTGYPGPGPNMQHSHGSQAAYDAQHRSHQGHGSRHSPPGYDHQQHTARGGAGGGHGHMAMGGPGGGRTYEGGGHAHYGGSGGGMQAGGPGPLLGHGAAAGGLGQPPSSGPAPAPPGTSDILSALTNPTKLQAMLTQYPQLLVTIKNLLAGQNIPVPNTVLGQLAGTERGGGPSAVNKGGGVGGGAPPHGYPAPPASHQYQHPPQPVAPPPPENPPSSTLFPTLLLIHLTGLFDGLVASLRFPLRLPSAASGRDAR
eukprot:gene19473-26132_t